MKVLQKMTIVYSITICYLHISTNDNINQTTTLVYNVNEKILVYCIIVNCPSIYQNTCWDTNSDRYCIKSNKRPEFQSFMMHFLHVYVFALNPDLIDENANAALVYFKTVFSHDWMVKKNLEHH